MKKCLLALCAVAITALVLTACGAGDDKLPVPDSDYMEYVGTQFSGQDPWGGNLTITIRTIINGEMDWTFTDAFEGHTLYQEQSKTKVENGKAEYSIEGKDAENKDVSFSYQGTLELKDGQVIFSFVSGAVNTSSSAGDSQSRMAEALPDSGISNEVTLVKAADDSLMEYVVQSGDSIHSIAKEYGITTKELAIINQVVIIETAQKHGHQFDDVIEYAKYLFPGEVLLVPKK